MTNKMVGRVLTYELGSWSYGDLKLKVEKILKRSSIHLQAWFMACGFFECGKEWYHFQQELMVSKMILKSFS